MKNPAQFRRNGLGGSYAEDFESRGPAGRFAGRGVFDYQRILCAQQLRRMEVGIGCRLQIAAFPAAHQGMKVLPDPGADERRFDLGTAARRHDSKLITLRKIRN